MLSADNLATLDSEGRRLGAIARESPESPVPQYPGWTLDDLAYHTAAVHGRTLMVCRDRAQDRVLSPRCPQGTSVFDWYDRTLEGLLAVFADTDPETPVWGFGPNPTIGFWERRMVIETGVHRRDAAEAGDGPGLLPDHVAVSGLDEFGEMWMPYLGEVQPLIAIATDLTRTWVFGEGTSAKVEGLASDIYVRLMSRTSPLVLPTDWAAAVDGLAPPPKPDRSPRV